MPSLEPAAASASYTSAHSVSSLTLPWWPVQAGVYRTATQLADGRISIIVDPGAWTNLMGATVSRKFAQRAIAAGHKPAQTRLDKPLNVRGVGNGAHACVWKMVCPIATPQIDGAFDLASFTTPIVEGSGSELPGLLGLRALKQHNAILDVES